MDYSRSALDYVRTHNTCLLGMERCNFLHYICFVLACPLHKFHFVVLMGSGKRCACRTLSKHVTSQAASTKRRATYMLCPFIRQVMPQSINKTLEALHF